MDPLRRRRKYIPGLAQIGFKPKFDWSSAEAREKFQNALSPLSLDTIHYGDCIPGMNEMPPDSVDLIVADPPFGIDFSGKEGQYNRKRENVVDGYAEITGTYTQFTFDWIACLSRILKKSGSAYIISGWKNLVDIPNEISKTNLITVNHIIWKYQFGVFTRKKFVTSHYHILFVVKDEKSYFFNKYEHYPSDVWEIPRTYMPGQAKNGTKLPKELVQRMIQFSSKPGDLVFDPFMGNATTAVCAKELFRHYYGFEINANMMPIHQENLNQTNVGGLYLPFGDQTPSNEELLKKYPHLKKFLP